jgi:mannose-1-phosphate guanylyltransferase / phosphomannomutase
MTRNMSQERKEDYDGESRCKDGAKMKRAIVMAGGQGSRLWPLTATRPKPLVPVANRPVIAHILHWLRRHDFSEVLIALHYRAEDLRRALGTGRGFGLRITYQVEKEPLGTAGCVKAAEAWIAGEPFLIASGDALTDVDLTPLLRQHGTRRAWVTLGLKRVHDPSHYGVVGLDAEGRVQQFQEKPGPGRAFSNLVSTGIYCVDAHVLRRIPPGRSVDWSHDIFPALLAEQPSLYGHELHGYWRDIGSIPEYLQGQRDVLAGALHADLPGTERYHQVWIGPQAHLAPGSVVSPPVLVGPGCRIEPQARLLPGTVLGAGTTVGWGAWIEGAVLGAGCVVGPGARLRDCVVDDQVQIGAGCVVEGGAVIGRGSRLAASAAVSHGCRIAPGQTLPVAAVSLGCQDADAVGQAAR